MLGQAVSNIDAAKLNWIELEKREFWFLWKERVLGGIQITSSLIGLRDGKGDRPDTDKKKKTEARHLKSSLIIYGECNKIFPSKLVATIVY